LPTIRVIGRKNDFNPSFFSFQMKAVALFGRPNVAILRLKPPSLGNLCVCPD